MSKFFYPLVDNPYRKKDIDKAIGVLKSFKITSGIKTINFQNFFKKKINFMNVDKQKNSTQVSGELLTKGWPNEAIPVVQKKTSVISRFFSIFFD